MLRLIRGAPGEGDMDARELFLDQHAAMHSAAVGGNRMSAVERTFAGLTDEQMRVRPREDLNSLAWPMWHIARSAPQHPVRVGTSMIRCVSPRST